MAPPLPGSCLECGACCFGDGSRYVGVSGDDHERLGAAGEPLTRFIGNRCYMHVVDGHCAALSVRRLGRQFVCTTYETRPKTCRTLLRESAECLAEFERKHRRSMNAMMLPVLT